MQKSAATSVGCRIYVQVMAEDVGLNWFIMRRIKVVACWFDKNSLVVLMQRLGWLWDIFDTVIKSSRSKFDLLGSVAMPS